MFSLKNMVLPVSHRNTLRMKKKKKGIEERMDFDPYLGRVVNPSQQAQQKLQQTRR